MPLYDIVQVEDDPIIRRGMARAAANANLSFLGISSLQALEEALPQADARYFVVDGKFPRNEGGQVLELASEAIASIKKQYPQARIILYSASMNAAELAQRNNVEVYGKEHLQRKLVAEIQKRLASP